MVYSFLVGTKNLRTSVLVVLIGLVIILNGPSSFLARAVAERSKVHIVYLGEKKHDDPKFVTESHQQMLSLLG
ncbi:hypothetical protein N665_0378s0010, partial [Sinapis alba]